MTTPEKDTPAATRNSSWQWNALSLGSLVALAALLYVVWRLRDVLLILVASLFLAYVLEPLVVRLSRLPLGRERTLGRKPAAGIVVVIATAGFLQALTWFVPVLWNEMARLGSELPRYYGMISDWLSAMGERRGMGLPPEVWTSLAEEWQGLVERGAASLGQRLPGLLSSLGSVLGLIVVPIGTFYILADGGALARAFVNGLPVSWRSMTRTLLTEADRSLETYVRGQTLVVLAAGALASIVFALLGVRYAIAIGVVAGLAEAVPFLGATAVFVALTLVSSDQGFLRLAVVLLAYGAINQVNNYVINPRLMGSRLSLHPFIIILAVLAGTSLGGPLGAVLALPATALIVALGGALWGLGRPESDT